jgi:hypothetical protein
MLRLVGRDVVVVMPFVWRLILKPFVVASASAAVAVVMVILVVIVVVADPTSFCLQKVEVAYPAIMIS